MKCSGRVGYYLNLKKEYGERAEMLLKRLEEDKMIQGGFITSFIQTDYINITKILLYLMKCNKVITCFDGLYVDKEYQKYFVLYENDLYNNICQVNKTNHIKDEKSNIIMNNNILYNNITSDDKINKNIHNDITKNETRNVAQENIDIINHINYNNNKENVFYNNIDDKNIDYKKINIQESELLNINDIIKYDGSVENVEKIIYYLNPCSILCAYFLDIKYNENVLDMCASPGGKSLYIVNKLFGYSISPLNRIKNVEMIYADMIDKNVNINKNNNDNNNNNDNFPNNYHHNIYNETKKFVVQIDCCMDVVNYNKINREGFLVINEYNKVRYERLKKVLNKYIPSDLINRCSNIHVTNYNGLNINSFMRFPKFHKILLDVPCSTDEHIIKQGTKELNKWSIHVIKNNSDIQLQLLINAFNLLHTGGVIIYSTCALSYHENDYVIEKFLKKYKNNIQIIDFIQEEYEKKISQYLSNSINNKTNHNHNIDSDNNNNNNNNKSYQYINHCKENTFFLKFFEKTTYGYISLPDRSPFGILYICKIKKI
ncbi:tRNA m5C-methyltransferase, putative [Plasmodium sp. gorilla clade G2]|uniref:tRNA m5C-methyltransferase, putative n=1 Tax=Plasmodium sp. gorilla clade G2 TaxID=880535 RepID=UPI000D22B40D|nr:tRNA m5C-methyltransferase, putative [Plasmodium sp. gorilla clade G2]SOV15433.1 tRNA m5C-methyltransferase, putative [Plasmodium sp. gorilla clade G2]